METMNISLPAVLKHFVETQVDAGQFSTASEYVRKLIREDQLQKERAAIDQKLLEALDSGFSPMTNEDWEQIRAEVRRRMTKQTGR